MKPKIQKQLPLPKPCQECGAEKVVTRSGWIVCPNGHGRLSEYVDDKELNQLKADGKAIDGKLDLKQFADGMKQLK